METIERSTSRPRPGRTWALVGAGLVGGVMLAGFATATAQTPSPSTSDDDTTATAPAPGRGHGGPGGPGGKHGMGMGIHGEFVTANPAGDGWQTIATQKGEVTAVSATSITVKSEDGYSRTYTVNDDTLVNAGNEGITDVAKGDDVRVMAVVVSGKANAVSVDDGTNIERLRGRWAPARPEASASTDNSSAT